MANIGNGSTCSFWSGVRLTKLNTWVNEPAVSPQTSGGTAWDYLLLSICYCVACSACCSTHPSNSPMKRTPLTISMSGGGLRRACRGYLAAGNGFPPSLVQPGLLLGEGCGSILSGVVVGGWAHREAWYSTTAKTLLHPGPAPVTRLEVSVQSNGGLHSGNFETSPLPFPPLHYYRSCCFGAWTFLCRWRRLPRWFF